MPRKGAKREFTLQYHLTTKCDSNCSHCYLRENTYQNERKNEHTTKQVKLVIDNYLNFVNELTDLSGVEIDPVIHFTGGDPLLRDDFYEILEYAVKKGIKTGMLGNPDNLTTVIAHNLHSIGLRSYQVSLDGEKTAHEKSRGEDSFFKTLKAINIINLVGIRKSFIMYNVTKENMGSLKAAYDFANVNECYGFVFARVCNIGNAKNLDLQIEPNEYRALLHDISTHVDSLELQGRKHTRLILKEPLWSLYHYEQGTLEIDKGVIEGGCGMGINMLSVLADGTVYACRRVPSPLGVVPRDNFMDIFTHDTLEQFRDFDNLTKCKSCPIINVCRGCPAVAHGQTGDYFAPDPQCWFNPPLAKI